MNRRFWAFGTLIAMLSLAASAQERHSATQVEPAEVEAGQPPHFTEDVTVMVTARQREENPQLVPFSVVAPTQQALRNRGAESVEDVSANLACFSVQNLGPGRARLQCAAPRPARSCATSRGSGIRSASISTSP